MTSRPLPDVLQELHRLEFDYTDGDGIDFEPAGQFLSADETRDWIRAWTGNASLDGAEYRVFGQDGSGGLAAFWCVRPNVSLLGQPIVFFGSEGALGVVANDFWDYLWLLAGGFGPLEAVEYPGGTRPEHSGFKAFASVHAAANRKAPAEVLARARAAFPDFESGIRAACR